MHEHIRLELVHQENERKELISATNYTFSKGEITEEERRSRIKRIEEEYSTIVEEILDEVGQRR